MKITTFFLIAILLVSCNTESKKEKYTEISKISNHYEGGYVGDQNCVECHQDEVDLWKGSHHDLAMQVANDSTVLGDFNNVETTIDGVSYVFFKKGTDFLVRIKEIDNSEKEYKINYTFGVTPLQQYLIDFDKGRKQTLRATWDVIDKKWFHQYKDDTIDPNDWLHWTNDAQNWNTMCAECHSTNLKKNYSTEEDSFNTTYSFINVTCESCHGPAEKHLAWAENNTEGKDPSLLNVLEQKDQLNICASCHARRVKLTENLVPGENFEDQFMVQNLTTNYYHGDGQINEEDYVYGSFMQSKMFAEGIKCNDCHNAHSLKLKFEDNRLCHQCHGPNKYETEDHYFHEPNTEASLCINCHMTGQVYMGNDFRRDHSFRNPRPDQSVKYGTPNACIGCHDDKSNQWAADIIIEKFGEERAPHFSDNLLLSSKSVITPEERQQLDNFINDISFPEIARSTVIENLSFTTPEQFKVLFTSLKDSSAIVRYNALRKFNSFPQEQRVSIALENMKDTVKLVRIAAAHLVTGFDENTLSGIDKRNFITSRGELETMLYSNSDFSIGRMQLGDYFLQNNDVNNAIKHYEIALKKDSLLIPVFSNLATAYSIIQNNEKAFKTLDTWIQLDPENGRPHYLKGLLNFENNQPEEAVKNLKKAIQLDPQDTRSMYNLATYYYQSKELKLAENYINTALKIYPNNPEYLYLLSFIYKDQGKVKQGQDILNQLKASQN